MSQHHSSENSPLLDSTSSPFAITVEDLKILIAERDARRLLQMGGVSKIAKGLNVDINVGLRSDQRQDTRLKYFGKNVGQLSL